MRISGTNIETKNNSGLTKDVIIKHRGIQLELKSIKRGVAIIVYEGKCVKNGDQYLIIPKDAEVFDFEKEL